MSTATLMNRGFSPTAAARTRGGCTGSEITGTLDGYRVRLDTTTRGGNNAKNFTRFCVEYPQPLGLGFKLSKQEMMRGMTKLGVP